MKGETKSNCRKAELREMGKSLNPRRRSNAGDREGAFGGAGGGQRQKDKNDKDKGKKLWGGENAAKMVPWTVVSRKENATAARGRWKGGSDSKKDPENAISYWGKDTHQTPQEAKEGCLAGPNREHENRGRGGGKWISGKRETNQGDQRKGLKQILPTKRVLRGGIAERAGLKVECIGLGSLRRNQGPKGNSIRGHRKSGRTAA